MGNPGNAARVGKHSDDARRSLISRRHQVKLFHQFGVGGKTAERHRARVEHFIEISAQCDHHTGLTFPREVEHGFGKRSPTKMRFGADAENKIFIDAKSRAMIKIVRRPMNFTNFVVV